MRGPAGDRQDGASWSNSTSRRGPSACGAVDAVHTGIASCVSPRDQGHRGEWRWQQPVATTCSVSSGAPGAMLPNTSTKAEAAKGFASLRPAFPEKQIRNHRGPSLNRVPVAALEPVSRSSAFRRKAGSSSEPCPRRAAGQEMPTLSDVLSEAHIGATFPRPRPFLSKALAALSTVARWARGSPGTPDDGERGDVGSRWHRDQGLHPPN